jgi:GTPase SAR1 family protein
VPRCDHPAPATSAAGQTPGLRPAPRGTPRSRNQRLDSERRAASIDNAVPTAEQVPSGRQRGEVYMIGEQYKEKKTAVLDIWRRYCSYRGETNDGVDLEFLRSRADAIEKGKYVLAVVGEAKAGKSTLINALLGDRILPTDVLQSSSAIVEIFKADKKFLEIKYGDNHTETVVDDPSTPEVDKAFEHLRRIGAVQDRFRPIPTTVIDQYILQRRIAPDRIPFDALEAASERKLRNEETRRLIEEYVKERTLANIPTEIRIGFPLKYAYDELCVVDTPGVNAVGGIQDRTFFYLNQANALLFVHSLEGSIEASSFHKFIKQVVPKQTTEALFLVLSKSGLKSEFEIAAKLAEARKQFAEYFDPQRILHVDSMLKIVADDLTRFDSAAALKAHYKDRRNHFAALIRTEDRQEWRDEVINFETKLQLLNNTLESLEHQDPHEQVLNALRNASNFRCLEKALDDFSAQAPQLQLSEVLQAVRRGYENQIAAHEQNIDLLKKKSKHPQTFENEISEHQRLLKEYQRELNEFTEVIHRKYTGVNAANRDELQRSNRRTNRKQGRPPLMPTSARSLSTSMTTAAGLSTKPHRPSGKPLVISSRALAQSSKQTTESQCQRSTSRAS